ncbi:MAG: LysR family transcriptional regulator [Deltaproteobacteria bacterium]|nr:LysR family transcriptional regulator [Deltaproteobacteria bacterium]
MKTAPHWELSVLCRAVEHLNLSAASAHIGVSQPQLSRIVARIESELGVVLLDRSVRRKSTWTPEARKLAEIYRRSARVLEAEVQGLVGQARPSRLAVGCLEGLVELAAGMCHAVLVAEKLATVELDVHDIDTLETLFLNGTLDVIYTSRELVRRKPKFSRVVASQLLELTGSNEQVAVRSHYEHRGIPLKRGQKTKYETLILSNSLMVRKHWLERFGGQGIIPSKPRKPGSKSGKESPVHLFASERLPGELWKRIAAAGTNA